MRGGVTDISDEAFLQAKREKKWLYRLVFGRKRRVDQGLRAQFYQAVKTLSFIKRARAKRDRERDTRGQEKSFTRNYWAFSKRVVNGFIGKEEERPGFDGNFSSEWYKNHTQLLFL